MNERLLQFIWQFQYFNKQQLQTTEGEDVVIEKPGTWNHHQGPDFSETLIRIGQTRWAGHVELHLRSSDWEQHGHGADRHYDKIVLHVVWKEDKVLYDHYGNCIPTLVLENRIPGVLLTRYSEMMDAPSEIPCHSFLPALDELSWFAWKERLAVERLNRKADYVLLQLERNKGHWEEVLWQMLAAGFGGKLNGILFEQIASGLTLPLLMRHQGRPDQLEALLLGQANLLNEVPSDAYHASLQDEYAYLRHKYELAPVSRQAAFLRMRPAGFPTIRLSQLAMLLHRNTRLFATLCEVTEPRQMMASFNITAAAYWNSHYRFGETSPFQPKQLGMQMAGTLMVNTAIPVLFAYGTYHKIYRYRERAIQWLYHLSAEDNRITRNWQELGIPVRSAMDAQSLIELTNSYCATKKCLECAVGNKVLHPVRNHNKM